MIIETSSSVGIPSNVVSKKVDADIVVLNLDDGTYFKLNETGAVVWEHLSQGKTIEDVIHIVLNKYESSYEAVKEDVISLISSLRDEELLKIL